MLSARHSVSPTLTLTSTRRPLARACRITHVTQLVSRFALAACPGPVSREFWLAGALAWSYGEGPTLFMLIYVVHRWFRDDTRRAVEADRHADVHGHAELDAYNEYLTALARKDAR